MRIGSLFAGIGGFDLAARWMGWDTAWVSEIDPYASAVLKKYWPNAPNLGDITKISKPPTVDILCGGFPCQDISVAGRGAGIEGEQSGLWKHYARLVDEIRPKYVVAENSPALRSRGLAGILKDLMALGYDAEWHCIPAAYVGAPHRRDRTWIIAYPHGKRNCLLSEDTLRAGGNSSEHGIGWASASGICRVDDGAPPRWTAVDASETPSSRTSRTRSSKPSREQRAE